MFMTMPARLCAGRESEFRDPHMRLVDLDGCNSLWASGHDGFLSVGGIVGIEIHRILPRARSPRGSVSRSARVGLLATLAWGASNQRVISVPGRGLLPSHPVCRLRDTECA